MLRLYPDWELENRRRGRYYYGDEFYRGDPYLGDHWDRNDPSWWDDYYWGGRLGTGYGSKFRRPSRLGSRYGSRYGSRCSKYNDGLIDTEYDPYYRGYSRNSWHWWDRKNTYNGKRDPNAKSGDYGSWYGIPDEEDRPPYYHDLPPPRLKHQDWNPYLWRRDQPPPFWMHGKDKKRHWEFKKEWERWYKGDSKDWWNKFIPDDFKGKVEDLVNNKIQKVANDLTEKERALYNNMNTLRNTNKTDDVKKKRYLEEIQRLKNKIRLYL